MRNINIMSKTWQNKKELIWAMEVKWDLCNWAKKEDIMQPCIFLLTLHWTRFCKGFIYLLKSVGFLWPTKSLATPVSQGCLCWSPKQFEYLGVFWVLKWQNCLWLLPKNDMVKNNLSPRLWMAEKKDNL